MKLTVFSLFLGASLAILAPTLAPPVSQMVIDPCRADKFALRKELEAANNSLLLANQSLTAAQAQAATCDASFAQARRDQVKQGALLAARDQEIAALKQQLGALTAQLARCANGGAFNPGFNPGFGLAPPLFPTPKREFLILGSSKPEKTEKAEKADKA